MKRILCSVLSFMFLCGFIPLSSLNGGIEVTTNSPGWEIDTSNSTIKAYNEKSKTELTINLADLLPSSVYCVSNKKVKDIKISVLIHKIASEGEGNWEKSFEKTKIYFSGKGSSDERKVYASNLIKDNNRVSAGVVTVGTLDFLSPITCKDIDNMTMRIYGMKDGNRNIDTLILKIKLSK